ncbi:MAG TPA: DNA-3-methyladenine glycosylase 2, partial [Verrucomicrobiae bacterium]|nr:DNA-3-methyladenine glycosylase 2 [Verrucomicrobiae bacterium]
FLSEHSLAELAAKIGITDRQLRRVFQSEFGVAPVEFSQTQRLLLAKQLLTDSTMPVTMVAYASGFKSLRRFNALLKQRYRLTPTEFRKQQKNGAARNFAEFRFRLYYRPPFDWERLLGFLSQRVIPRVEEVRNGAYFRTVQINRQNQVITGHLEVSHDEEKHVLNVRLSDSLLPVCAPILERLKRLFDLQADPLVINSVLGKFAERRPGLRLPGSFDGFEMAVRAVLGQQISVTAASTLAGRLALRFGEPLSIPPVSPVAALDRLFPTPQKLASATVGEIGRLGIPGRRAKTLIALSRAVADGALSLEPGNRIEDTFKELHKIPGIGEWTVQYIAMRALSWPDAFPHTDLGVRKAMATERPDEVLRLAEKWRPWRAYATLHLWADLTERTKL